jgi:hypothetical protein
VTERIVIGTAAKATAIAAFGVSAEWPTAQALTS